MAWKSISLHSNHNLLITNSSEKACYAKLSLPIAISTTVCENLHGTFLELSHITAHLFFGYQIKSYLGYLVRASILKLLCKLNAL